VFSFGHDNSCGGGGRRRRQRGGCGALLRATARLPGSAGREGSGLYAVGSSPGV